MLGNRREKGRRPYYFTRAQLILLAAGFTATSVVIFFLGILIGKGIEERKLLKKEEPLVKIPVQPLIPGSKTGAPPKEEMTFYDTLAKARTAAQPAKETKEVEKAAKPEVKETRPPAKQAGALPAKDTKEKAIAEKAPTVPETKKEAPAQKAQEAVASKTGTAKREGSWTVQINAFPNEKEAKALAKKLKDKGYDCYIVPTKIKGRSWYRVRVGHFENREQAQEMQETLKQKENFTKSITTSR